MASPISDSWTEIIAWLRTNAPEDCIELFGAATPEMIASTAAEMGIAFPEPLAEFYQRLDGAESGSVFPSPDEFDMAFCPMPLQEVLVHWVGQKQLVEMGQFDDLTPRSAAGIR